MHRAKLGPVLFSPLKNRTKSHQNKRNCAILPGLVCNYRLEILLFEIL